MDGGATKRIAAACVAPPARRVVEIGAGTGALTYALLAAGADVTAIEIDAELVGVLRQRHDLPDATIVEGDALAYDYDAAGETPWCAAGNLPYNVATALISQWIALRHPPARIVVMVQRDVADRLTAAPGTPPYGSLTVAVSYAMAVRRAFILGPGAFYPKPGVDSAVVIMERHQEPPVDVRDRDFLLKVVRGAFAYRRKTLANSLSLALGIDRGRTQAALAAANVDTEIRAEQLDLAAFGALSDRLGV